MFSSSLILGVYQENSKDQSLQNISPVITEISQQRSPYFLIAKAYSYPFSPKYAEQFVPGPILQKFFVIAIILL